MLLTDDLKVMEFDEEENEIRKVEQSEFPFFKIRFGFTQIVVFRGAPYTFECFRDKLLCFSGNKWSYYFVD